MYEEEKKKHFKGRTVAVKHRGGVLVPGKKPSF